MTVVESSTLSVAARAVLSARLGHLRGGPPGGRGLLWYHIAMPPKKQGLIGHTCAADGCRREVPAARAERALSRGMSPRYCSDECRLRQGNRESYARRQGLRASSPGVRSIAARRLFQDIVRRAEDADVLQRLEADAATLVLANGFGNLHLVDEGRGGRSQLVVLWVADTLETPINGPIPQMPTECRLSDLEFRDAILRVFDPSGERSWEGVRAAVYARLGALLPADPGHPERFGHGLFSATMADNTGRFAFQVSLYYPGARIRRLEFFEWFAYGDPEPIVQRLVDTYEALGRGMLVRSGRG
jgi:hypothetical protein